MTIKQAIFEFVFNINAINNKTAERINIDLPIDLCYRLMEECEHEATYFRGVQFPIIINIYGTEIIIHSKESKAVIINNKLKELYKELI